MSAMTEEDAFKGEGAVSTDVDVGHPLVESPAWVTSG